MSLKFPLFVISDSHFLDENLIKYCGRPVDQDQRMVKNWQRAVKENDTVLHLGDLFSGAREDFLPISKSLPGNKYLILGNHDKENIDWYRYQAGFTPINRFSIPVSYRGWRITFSHVPVILTYKNEINVHGHTHTSYFNGLTRQHLNTCVEVLDYTPKDLKKLLDYKIDYQLGGDYCN